MKGYLHYLDLQKRKEFYRELRQVGEAHRSLTSSSRMIAFYLGKQLEKEQKLLKKSSKNMKSSYTLKCIWAAKGLLKSGLVWRVRNGHNIRIEADV